MNYLANVLQVMRHCDDDWQHSNFVVHFEVELNFIVIMAMIMILISQTYLHTIWNHFYSYYFDLLLKKVIDLIIY